MGCLSRIEEAEEQTRKVARESVAGDKKRKRRKLPQSLLLSNDAAELEDRPSERGRLQVLLRWGLHTFATHTEVQIKVCMSC